MELRSTVVGHSALAADWQQVERVYRAMMAPQVLIHTLEDLIREGVLTPLVARRMEEHVLRQTNRSGQWKGT
jgi:hypothetical protein